MSSLFGGGGGGGSPPKAPKLGMVDTSLTGPMYTQSAAIGDQWARMMRASYGLGPAGPGAPASWEAQYLGPGALAMMGQAQQGIAAPGQDPQVSAALSKGFGGGFSPGQGTFGGGGAGSSWDLGATPFQVSKELGQPPLQQLQRTQGFTSGLLKQWQPPDLRLTGEDLLNVKMGNMTAAGQAQQQAFQQALAGSSMASQAQSAAQAAEMAALGKGVSGAINAFGPSVFSGLGGGGANAAPPSDVAPGGGTFPTDIYGNAYNPAETSYFGS